MSHLLTTTTAPVNLTLSGAAFERASVDLLRAGEQVHLPVDARAESLALHVCGSVVTQAGCTGLTEVGLHHVAGRLAAAYPGVMISYTDQAPTWKRLCERVALLRVLSAGTYRCGRQGPEVLKAARVAWLAVASEYARIADQLEEENAHYPLIWSIEARVLRIMCDSPA